MDWERLVVLALIIGGLYLWSKDWNPQDKGMLVLWVGALALIGWFVSGS